MNPVAVTRVRISGWAPRGFALEVTTAAAVAVAMAAAITFRPALAITASSVALATLLWAAGGKIRRSTAIAALAALPIVVGAGRYANVLPASVTRAEDVVLALGFLPLPGVYLRQEVVTRRLVVLFAMALSAVLLLGALRSHGGLGLAVAATWQDLRWIGALGWGLYLGRGLRRAESFSWAFGLLAGWGLAQIIVALAQARTSNVSGYRFSLPVVGGAFGHPTLGAIAGTMLLLFVFSDRFSYTRCLTLGQRMAGTCIGVLAVLTSTRAKPLLAVAGVALVYIAKRNSRGRAATIAAFVSVPIFFFGALPFVSSLGSSADPKRSVTANVAAHAIPRVTLLRGADRLADAAFPFGWGMGTFGSNLDGTVEANALAAAGLGNIWGFSATDPAFRSDSLLAQVLAEAGWIGMAMWLLSFVILLTIVLRLSPTHFFPTAVVTAALSLAPIAPSLHDSTIALLMFMPAGLCLALRTSPASAGDEE